jgi:hypothetical protein
MTDKEKQPKTSAAKKPNGKVFDVSRPGKAAASPTSKPVILGHNPDVQTVQASVSGIGEARPLLSKRKIEITPFGDLKQPSAEPPKQTVPARPEADHPQPTQDEKDALGTAALDGVTGSSDLSGPSGESVRDKRLLTPSKLTIQPLTEAEKSATEPAKELKEESAESEPAADTTESQPEPEPKLESEPESKTEEPTVEPTPTVEQPAEKPAEVETTESSPDQPAAETSPGSEVETLKGVEEKEEPAPEPVIEPLFDDSGAIVVSTHEHHRHHHGLKVFLLLVLIIILAAAGLDILLDLGILDLPNLPHTDFL